MFLLQKNIIKKFDSCYKVICQKDFDTFNYRHYELRNKVKRQALAISQLKNGEYAEADRIKGIDACSPELWCRPEVFAQAFQAQGIDAL